jgi:hypothetical protein
MIFNRKSLRKSGASRLTLRLWDFTGTAMLNLLLFLFLIAYLSPIPFMVIASLTPRDQFLDARAPILPSERVKFEYEGKERIVYKVPTKMGQRGRCTNRAGRQANSSIPRTRLLAQLSGKGIGVRCGQFINSSPPCKTSGIF